MSTTDQIGSGSGIDAETWAAAQSSPEFTTLRRRLRNFVFPVSALFLTWYLVYVLLADYAHGFMSIKLVGNINVGLVLGLLQFVSTFAITTWYVRFANRNLDPVAEEIRESLEGGAAEKAPAEKAEDAEKDSADDGEAPEKSEDDSVEKDSADDGEAPEKSEDDSVEKDSADDGEAPEKSEDDSV
ncbi:DUF485 domain-containing protein, partial [Saccharopolyspora sp. NPDC050389]|uniref:DUF485 domain-containing protein n=1 Tax=Saccharopolyspora sp. NPDC050389 TaxID=3155516 RepID=UPI0033E2D6E0